MMKRFVVIGIILILISISGCTQEKKDYCTELGENITKLGRDCVCTESKIEPRNITNTTQLISKCICKCKTENGEVSVEIAVPKRVVGS